MVEWTDVSLLDDLKVRLVASKCGLTALEFRPSGEARGGRNDDHPLLRQAARELGDYFAGSLRVFRTPLDLQGTEFQLRVWNQLLEIPFGETRSYSQVAEAIGRPKAVRAVGAANGSNPVAIMVPCHRVIGSGGRLTGYGGGLPLKKKLLELEGAWSMDLRL